MQTPNDYADRMAMNWGDTTHSFAWQKTGDAKLHRDTLPATPEALHD